MYFHGRILFITLILHAPSAAIVVRSTPTTMIRATGNLDGRGAAGPPVLSSGTLARLLPLRESLVAVSIPSPV